MKEKNNMTFIEALIVFLSIVFFWFFSLPLVIIYAIKVDMLRKELNELKEKIYGKAD